MYIKDPWENTGSNIFLPSKITGSKIMLWMIPTIEIAIFTVDKCSNDISKMVPQPNRMYTAIQLRIILELLLNPAR